MEKATDTKEGILEMFFPQHKNKTV